MFKQIKNELKTENCFYFYCLILNFVHNRFDLKNHTRSQDSKKTSCMFWQKFLWSVELTRFYNTYLSWLQRDAQFIKLSYHITNRILAVGYIIYYLFAQQKSLLLALVVASFIDFLKKNGIWVILEDFATDTYVNTQKCCFLAWVSSYIKIDGSPIILNF